MYFYLHFKGENSLHFVHQRCSVGFKGRFNSAEDFAALELVASGRGGGGRVLEALGVDGDDDGAAEAEVVLKGVIYVRDLSLVR